MRLTITILAIAGLAGCFQDAQYQCGDNVSAVPCADDAGTQCPSGVFDTTRQTCVQCIENTDCAVGVCLSAVCVDCTTDAHCTTDAPHCDGNVCGPCRGNLDCAQHLPGAGLCQPDGSCAGCSADADCASSIPGTVCDESTGECVACQIDADCDEGHCDPPAGVCVDCTIDGHCSAPTPACDVSVNTCTECLSDTHCGGGEPRCDVLAQSCVECLDDGDCSAPGAARCDITTNTCAPCAARSACESVPGLPECSSGTCVECSPASESLDCGSESCNPADNTCTGIDRGTRLNCDECLSDSDCGADHFCVPIDNALNVDEGLHCLRQRDVGCVGGTRRDLTATSANGVSGDFCQPNPAVTTCAAVRAMLEDRPCVTSVTCALAGGQCLDVGGPLNRCRARCGNAGFDCPDNFTQCGGTGLAYCGPD